MPGVVVLTIIFAPTPCTLHTNNIVDLNSKLGHDLYNKAISTITIPFDRNSNNINLSQSQLLRRFENSGWMAEVTLQTLSSIVSQVESDHTTWNLPRKLLKVRPPLCAYCKVGTMTRMPWHVKKSQLRKVKVPPEIAFQWNN